jgi:uncharacterized coiled-coil DUF342 family protein
MLKWLKTWMKLLSEIKTKMKSIMLYCKKYKVKVGKLSQRPEGIKPEPIKEKKQSVKNCIVTLITVEKQDNIKKCSEEMSDEILKFAKEVKTNKVAILPFAHLSSNLADSKRGINFFKALEDKLSDNLKVTRGHYGSDKSLLLDIRERTGNVRFREF